jgi:hypothetical protein
MPTHTIRLLLQKKTISYAIKEQQAKGGITSAENLKCLREEQV